MAKLSEEFAYRLARFGKTMAGWLTPGAADRLGASLGMLGYYLIPSRREIAAENLRRAFGPSLSEREINTITRNVFRNIGRTLFEIARFEKMGPEGIAGLMVPTNTENFVEMHREGKGAILVTAHFGNWEMLGGWLHALGYDFKAIATVQHNQKINAMLDRMRAAIGVDVIPVKAGALREVFKALHENKFVAIVSDQHDPSRELILDFFGRPASVPKGPAMFAVKAGCPLAVYLTRRERYDRHIIMFGGQFQPPNTGDLEADVRALTQTYLKTIEDLIRQYPDQWLWTHRRWKI